MLLDPKPALSEKAGSDDSAKYGLKITEERISIKMSALYHNRTNHDHLERKRIRSAVGWSCGGLMSRGGQPGLSGEVSNVERGVRRVQILIIIISA